MSDWQQTQWESYEARGSLITGYEARKVKPIPHGRVRCGSCGKDLVPKKDKLPDHKCDGGIGVRAYYRTRTDIRYVTAGKAVGALKNRLEGEREVTGPCAEDQVFLGTPEEQQAVRDAYAADVRAGRLDFPAWREARAKLPGAQP